MNPNVTPTTTTTTPTSITERRVAAVTLGFVVLGVALRVARYLMNYPLWWDEAFVGVNLLRRGYLDLLRPLDYGQVAPILFLWAELSAVKLVGFSEWSLRLFPLACSVLSVVLFRRAAGRVLSGWPLAMSVGIFAVSYHPIRHAADVKPYASDLLVALALLTLAFEWRASGGKARWLWALVAASPVALALSLPAVFVAGGIGLAVGPGVWRDRRNGSAAAYAGFLGVTVVSFLGLYFLYVKGQSAATLGLMAEQWVSGFPPRGDLGALVAWLARVHTGSIFAYPVGGEGGASVVTSLAFLAGAVALWRRRRKTALALCLAPFALALAASAVRRYPYGGVTHGSPARVMQFLAPAVCLLAGAGGWGLVCRLVRGEGRARAVRLAVVGLVLVGVVPLAAEWRRPYRAFQAERAREFARAFWPTAGRDAELVCLRWDLGVGAWDSTDLNVAVYLCNQRIYSPGRQRGRGPGGDPDSGGRPLRCVESLAKANDPAVAAWLRGMGGHYVRTARRAIDLDTAGPGATPRSERYVVHEFVPRGRRSPTPRYSRM